MVAINTKYGKINTKYGKKKKKLKNSSKVGFY